jgi:hypothetical protein
MSDLPPAVFIGRTTRYDNLALEVFRLAPLLERVF